MLLEDVLAPGRLFGFGVWLVVRGLGFQGCKGKGLGFGASGCVKQQSLRLCDVDTSPSQRPNSTTLNPKPQTLNPKPHEAR